MRFSGVHLLILLAVIVLLFGAKKIPEFARSVGEASREFRQGAGMDAPHGTAASSEDGSSSVAESGKVDVSTGTPINQDLTERRQPEGSKVVASRGSSQLRA